ncbi:malto-oligosyltrehalose trehalohydrolase [Rhizobium sp. G21]|uniref:malto-oligosyltrehalose trehalohydrolase n=1 Tax=Rhizobium sp. G21 TaxID=2758439 RepID=UPI00160352AA|nr:malto-oligosyltrehalose trehalohydrolase [Rhizobium sp. G21]MBB1249885.1 malto-oligosyltrehalose trehalohydrolase [Rhizobium sp. G21]
MIAERRYPIGAELREDGCAFRLWAPERDRVDLVLDDHDHPMEREDDGYFSLAVAGVKEGALYHFRLDGGEALFADPASRRQPEGPTGPSMVVNAHSFVWQDAGWTGVVRDGQVVYEMHIGTFTPEGTWAAAAKMLPRLQEVGVTVVEMMPVNEFDGAFGWGYDGVLPFAPTRLYGSPDDLKAFIDTAHSLGIGVILDVVYNHFGPGHRFKDFSRFYFSQGPANEWGEAINFDGENSGPVREFFIANAAYWIEEFHFDGLRIDAIQALIDKTRPHIVGEISRACRRAGKGRAIYIVGENEPQEARLVKPLEEGGDGLDSLWNDDFHHSAKVALTGRNEAYLHDHRGAPQEFIAAAKYGYLFQGQRHDWQDYRRGSPSLDLKPSHFIHFLQNHDQIANSAKGLRMSSLASPPRIRAMTALLMLGPQTPMLFQGQEFGAATNFHYFADQPHSDTKALVRNGRSDFLSQFPSIRDPEIKAGLADPCDRATFESSRLDWSEWEKNISARALHADLVSLRRGQPAFRSAADDRRVDGSVLSTNAFFLRFFADESAGDLLLLLNFGADLPVTSVPDPLFAAPAGCEWSLLWSSEWSRYGGTGQRPIDLMDRFLLSADSALVFAGKPERPRSRRDAAGVKVWQDQITF